MSRQLFSNNSLDFVNGSILPRAYEYKANGDKTITNYDNDGNIKDVITYDSAGNIVLD